MKFNGIFLACVIATVFTTNIKAMDPYHLVVPGDADDVEMVIVEAQAAPIVHLQPNQFVYHTPVNQMIQPAQNPPHIHAPANVLVVDHAPMNQFEPAQYQENQAPQ